MNLDVQTNYLLLILSLSLISSSSAHTFEVPREQSGPKVTTSTWLRARLLRYLRNIDTRLGGLTTLNT